MGYIAQKNTRLDGVDYEPGDAVPDSAVNGHVIDLGLVATVPDESAQQTVAPDDLAQLISAEVARQLAEREGEFLSASVSSTADAYDPADHNVAEVIEYATAHPDEVESIRAAEEGEGGKGRTTLLDGLDELATNPDGDSDANPDAGEGDHDGPDSSENDSTPES